MMRRLVQWAVRLLSRSQGRQESAELDAIADRLNEPVYYWGRDEAGEWRRLESRFVPLTPWTQKETRR